MLGRLAEQICAYPRVLEDIHSSSRVLNETDRNDEQVYVRVRLEYLSLNADRVL